MKNNMNRGRIILAVLITFFVSSAQSTAVEFNLNAGIYKWLDDDFSDLYEDADSLYGIKLLFNAAKHIRLGLNYDMWSNKIRNEGVRYSYKITANNIAIYPSIDLILLPKAKINPYFGVGAGIYTYEVISEEFFYGNKVNEYTSKEENKLGVSYYLGMQYSLIKYLRLNFGVNFHRINFDGSTGHLRNIFLGSSVVF